MRQFCNRKREREELIDETYTIPSQNKKMKNDEFSLPQNLSEIHDLTNMNINLIDSTMGKTNSINMFEKNSNSTLQSKKDLVFPDIKIPDGLFKIINFKENQNVNRNLDIKNIELQFDEIEEENFPIKSKSSFFYNSNIKRELFSDSSSSSNCSNNNNYNNSSHYSYSNSCPEEYYPYEIGELIENQYLVSLIYILIIFILFL